MLKRVTGQLFFREAGSAGHHPHPVEGKRIMMVVGILAIPDGREIKGEHQYTVSESPVSSFLGSPTLELHVHKDSAVDRTEVAYGCAVGSLLTSPIWRT